MPGRRLCGQVVVIGAGVAGLTAAARLAERGHRVTVFERSTVAGGKLGRFERCTPAGRFRFDTGPNLLTLPQVFDDLDGLHPVPLDPIVRHAFPDGTRLDSCADPETFAARIASAFGRESAEDWRRLWRRAGRVWDLSWRYVLTSTMDSPWAVARLARRIPDLAAIAPGQTLSGLGRRYLRDARMRALLSRYATYAGADPRRAPAALVAVPYAELTFGGWYLPGGLSVLADALLARCRALGVTVHTGTPVTRIEAPGGAVSGVRVAGRDPVPADAVVAAVDALHVYRDLLPTPGLLSGLRDRSLGGFVLMLGVRGRTPGMAHHTVFFPTGYGAEFGAVFGDPRCRRPPRPAPDPAVFVTVADDPTVRPAGYESWFVLVNAPPQGAVDWRAPEVADRYADRILDLLARRGADIRDRIVFREVRTPADLAALTGSPGGSIYGTAAHGLLRPPNRGPVPGLYLAGGSVHPGGGLPLVTLSAKIVADLLDRDLTGADRTAPGRVTA